MSDELERCRTAALRILQYRWNSELELRRKLARKQFAEDVIDTAIAQLRDEKWLDDERFAASLVRSRTAKRLGRRRIAGELRAAGVDDDMANAAIRTHLDAEREAEGLEAACARRLRVLRRRHGPEFPSSDDERNALAAYLIRQGYDTAAVFDAIRRVARA